MSQRHVICPVDDIPVDCRKIVEVDGISMGIFNIDGEYHAISNICPHQLAPLCEGRRTATVTAPEVGEYQREREGQILRCPWHGWEFDITTGESVFNPHSVKAATFEVGAESPQCECAATDSPDSKDDGRDEETYGTTLEGDVPPVDTYPVEVEEEYVVVYL